MAAEKKIRITAGDVTVNAVLNDTKTAAMIWKALPIEAKANTWGDEIYFQIPVRAELEEGKEVVELGDLGYWPPGRALCIFFGPTPVSKPGQIRPASAVTIVGKASGDLKALRRVKDGARVRIEPGAGG